MTGSKGLMQGKRGLVMGVANDHSIAYGIARKLGEHGAELAFTYQGEAILKRVAAAREGAWFGPCASLRRRGYFDGRRGVRRGCGRNGASSIFSSIPSPIPTRTNSRASTPTPAARILSARW